MLTFVDGGISRRKTVVFPDVKKFFGSVEIVVDYTCVPVVKGINVGMEIFYEVSLFLHKEGVNLCY